MTKEEYVTLIHQAMDDRKSNAHAQLYQFLVSCFVRADTNMEGLVSMDKFDSLVEEAAALPRDHGFAPSSKTLYKSTRQRKAARDKMFQEMDDDKSGYYRDATL
jgi:hypothetical protein